jgi:hypothetical protein
MLDFPQQQEVGMGQRMGLAASLLALVGLAVAPVAGEAAEHGGQAMGGDAKIVLSLTKDYTPSPWTQETGWSNRAVGKLGFGLKNLLLGWTDLFVEPKEAADAGGNLLKGIGVGLKDSIENELGGVVHLITFPITAIDAPLPEGGTQLLSS